MDRNLGASQTATRSTDEASYGDLYQWGRFADGHQCRNSATTSIISSSDTPDHGNFLLVLSEPYDWRSPQNNNLWQGVNGINNPCPGGYRLPTYAELNAERASWVSNDPAGGFDLPLKLPVSGGRNFYNGEIADVGYAGLYWSATFDGVFSKTLTLYNHNTGMQSARRANGFSIRCIKDW